MSHIINLCLIFFVHAKEKMCETNLFVWVINYLTTADIQPYKRDKKFKEVVKEQEGKLSM